MTPSGTRQISLKPQPDRRRIVLDEGINWKLTFELRRRGRSDATAVHLERLHGLKDGALLKRLARYEPCVLVTWDNKMERVHAAELEHHKVTVAVIDRVPFDSGAWLNTEEAYVRDVVHRRLHRIELQPPQIVQKHR